MCPKQNKEKEKWQYDNLHNITGKKQYIEQKGIQFDGVLKAGYDLAYNYANNPFQISTLKDDNYRTEGTDAKDVTKKEHKYEYDANGNLIYVNTERPKKDGTQTPKSTERKLLWDEENRLQAIDDNGFVSNYWYDAAGERTVKTGGESQQVYVNSVFSGGDTQTADFTAYVNPYLVVSKGGQYTKHIYIGSQRIVSKLGDLDSYGSDPRRIEYAGANVDGANVDYATKYEALQQTIKDRYATFEVPYYGKDNDDYVNGQGFCCADNVRLKSFSATGNDNPELFQYYYHSDHLGSSSLITNLDGEIVQHIEYVPFGEVFIEERNSTWNTPYLFNAKELDEETGLYYYGARYYDPRISIFYGVDPLVEKTGTPYQYCYQNPVKFIDPIGMVPSTDVVDNGDGTYTVVGGNATDNDYKIYVVNNAKERKRTGEVIGVTPTLTTFYNDTQNNKGEDYGWMGTIDTRDKSGENYFASIVAKTPKLDDYMPNATGGKIHDFKQTNNEGHVISTSEEYMYRGMSLGDFKGYKVYTSARALGNIVAGYVAAASGMGWEESRIALDALESYQHGKPAIEGRPTRDAQKFGHRLGERNVPVEDKFDRFVKAIPGFVKMVKDFIF